MKKILFYLLIFLLVSLLIGACSQVNNTPTPLLPIGSTNIPTETPAAVPPVPTAQPEFATQTPALQSRQASPTAAAISPQAVPSATQASVQPTTNLAAAGPTSCTDTVGFFGDVTIPDGTSLQQNVPFVKTWRIRNEGTCSWGPDYSLIFYGGDQMSGPPSVAIPAVAPGEITNISVNLKSPSSGGAFTGLWEFQNSSGQRFGVNSGGIDQIWVKIGVTIFNDTGEIVPVGSTPLPTAALVLNATQNPTAATSNTTTSNPTDSTSNNTSSNKPASSSDNTSSNPTASPLNKATPNPTTTTSNNPASTPSNTCTPQENSDFEQQILGFINNARVQNNLSPLTLNSKLSAAAFSHSSDMACKNYIDHTGSDGSTWFTRIQAEKYKYSYASENIYVGNPAFGGTPAGAFTWWMNSQIHRDNILSVKVNDIGIGYAFYPNSTYGGYYTLDFAKP